MFVHRLHKQVRASWGISAQDRHSELDCSCPLHTVSSTCTSFLNKDLLIKESQELVQEARLLSDNLSLNREVN